MPNITNWWNSNAYRAFPFREDSSLRLSSGKTLPNSVILDMSLIDGGITDDTTSPSVCLTTYALALNGNTYTETFGFRYQRTESDIADFDVQVTFNVSQTLGAVIVSSDIDMLPDVSGVCPTARIVFGPLPSAEEISELLGKHTFPDTPYVLSSRILQSQDLYGSRGLRCIPKAIGMSESVAYGDVHLRSGYNCDLQILDGAVVATAKLGHGIGPYCYESGTLCSSESLMFLNGQTADINGNINIVGGPGISVESGGLYMDDIPVITIKLTSELKSLFK